MRILGRALTVRPLADDLLEYLRATWDFPEVADALESDYAIALRTDDSDIPNAVLDAEAWHGHWGTRHLKVGPNELWILEGDSGVHLDVQTTGARIVLHGRPFRGWIALHVAITEALTADGLVRLHASAATDGRRTVLFTGPSGRGKSTTLLRAIEQGWAAIAEDGCMVDPGSYRLFGFDRSLRLLPDAAADLRTVLGVMPGPPGPSGKVEIDFDDLPAHAREARLTDIVHLERRADGPTEWVGLTRAQAVGALFESSGLPSTDLGRGVMAAAFGRLAQNVDAWRLVLGDMRPSLADMPPLTR